MDLAAIRSYVRGHIDLDIEDLPDVVLDVFIREGSKRIERAEARWPFYETEYTLNTVAGQADYDLTDVGADLSEIAAIIGPRWTLRLIGRDEADFDFPLNVNNTSEPAYYAEWGGSVRLYPTPNDVYTLTIRGYRNASDWVTEGAGAEPDLPDELHNSVAQWALARAYAQQDDPEMASYFERVFLDEVRLFQRRLNGSPRSQPIVLNGHSPISRPWRPRFDFQ